MNKARGIIILLAALALSACSSVPRNPGPAHTAQSAQIRVSYADAGRWCAALNAVGHRAPVEAAYRVTDAQLKAAIALRCPELRSTR